MDYREIHIQPPTIDQFRAMLGDAYAEIVVLKQIIASRPDVIAATAIDLPEPPAESDPEE